MKRVPIETGLKDSSGQEIRNGDKLTDGIDVIVVKWVDGGFVGCCENNAKDWCDLRDYNLKRWKIISPAEPARACRGARSGKQSAVHHC